MKEDQLRAAIERGVRAALGEPQNTGDLESGPTVFDLSTRYWREYARHQKSARDKKRIAELLETHFGKRHAITLTTGDCEDYRDWRRRKNTRLGGQVKPATLNRELSQLRHMLNWAVRLPPTDDMRLKYNPIALVKLEREHNVRRTQLRSEEDFQKALAFMNPTIRALAILLVDSGPRRMESINLRWDEFDHDTGVMDLFETKGDQPRRPRMSRRALKEILALPRLSPYVFANWRRGPWFGNRIDPSTALKHVQRAFKAAGVAAARGEAWCLHLLRHQYVRRSRVRDKLPEKMVMQQTGHKTRVAFDRYGIGDDSELEEAFRIADANIANDLRKLRKGPHNSSGPVEKGAHASAMSDKRQGQS